MGWCSQDCGGPVKVDVFVHMPLHASPLGAPEWTV